MAITTEPQLQNIQQTFQRLIFREAILPECPRIRAGKGTLYKINMLLLGERHQLQPHFIAQHTHNLRREDVLLLAALEQQFHLLPFEHFRLAVNLDA
ncbi:hypothetical protein D3C72_558750 [compost metagenome]